MKILHRHPTYAYVRTYSQCSISLTIIRLSELPSEFLSYSGLRGQEQDKEAKFSWNSGMFQLFHCLECNPYESVTEGVRMIPEEDLDQDGSECSSKTGKKKGRNGDC